jgi:hypothetical protein
MYILGNLFLNNYYTIYDLENKKIGLSIAIGSDTPSI